MPSIFRFGAGLRSTRVALVACAVLLVVAIALVITWPAMVRHLVVSQLEATTHRRVDVETIAVNPFTGRIAVAGLRVRERDGEEPLVELARLDARIKPLSLLAGHVWIRDAVFEAPTIRVVRYGDRFNFSDLLEREPSDGRALDTTVDRIVVTRGLVTLEDRALTEPRTWRAESIEIEGQNISTRRDDGTMTVRSVTAGAPVTLDMQRVRLQPVHFEAIAATTGLDLSLGRLYLPPDAPVVLERGRASSTVRVVYDAHEGVRADWDGEMQDVALVTPGRKDAAAVIPKLTLRLSDMLYRDDQLEIGRFEMAGSANVRDPRTDGRGRYQVSTLRASVSDVTWPVTRPGQLDVDSSVPGGGSLKLTGSLLPPPDRSQLNLRLAAVDLRSWAELIPLRGRVAGVVDANLRVDEPLAPGVPNLVQGSVSVSRLSISDERREVIAADRVAATGFDVHWPTRVAVKTVELRGPRAVIERDKAGELPLRQLLTPVAAQQPDTTVKRDASAGTSSVPAAGGGGAAQAPPLAVSVGDVVVKDGRAAWRDDAVTPRAALEFADIDAAVKGAAWPIAGPLTVHVSARPPDGGQVRVTGRVGLDPITADVKLVTTDAAIAPYQPYVPVPAHVSARANLDLNVAMPALEEGRATVRGQAVVSKVDIRDGQRTVVRAERAAATGLDIDWPRRVAVREIAMRQPWVLVERDREGGLLLRELLTPRAAANGGAASAERDGAKHRASDEAAVRVPVTIGRIAIEEGGARVVDHGVTPPFAVDMQRLAATVEDVSTDPRAKPARVDLNGRVAGTSLLALRGTVGSLGGPLKVDLNGDLRGLAVPRANPYLLDAVAWQAYDGWLTTSIRCRIDGDALDARSEIVVSRLGVAKVGGDDEAKARIGLPLGMLVSLMKNSQGEIRLALPVTGRLHDPRFDFSEAIWSTLKNVAVKAVSAPVSWIGRVRYTADNRIDRIEVTPIPFTPGQATLEPDAREQLSRVAAFLTQAPESRMALTPVVTARDRAALRERASPAGANGRPADARVPQDDVARPLATGASNAAPGSVEDPRAAEAERPPSPDLTELGTKRLEAVRDALKQAGIDTKRLIAIPATLAADGTEPRLKLDLVEPDSTKKGDRPNVVERALGKDDRASSGSRAAR